MSTETDKSILTTPVPGEAAPMELDEDNVLGSASKVSKSGHIDYEARLEELFAEQGALMLQIEEAIRGSSEETQLLNEAQNLTRKIDLYQDAVKRERESKKTGASKHAVIKSKETGLKLSRGDIPRFQLKYHYSQFFKGQPVYLTVEILLRQFEKTVVSAG